MTVIVTVCAAFGALLTVISVLVSILLYTKGAYSKQKMEELREDRDDAQRRAEAWSIEAGQKDRALEECARGARKLRAENEMFRRAPQLAVEDLSAFIKTQTDAIIAAVARGRDKPDA